jgi:hypothetical protein
MNEFEELERDLRKVSPKTPSVHFTSRIEEALGDSGQTAFRRIPGEDASESKLSNLVPFILTLSAGLGVAAVWALVSFLSVEPTSPVNEFAEQPALNTVSQREDEQSPIHGVSLGELESLSGMPVDGWMDPQVSERFLRRVDEGVFERPNGVPARRVRYDFMDDTLWLHPGSDLRIQSSTPRQEFHFIELELY